MEFYFTAVLLGLGFFALATGIYLSMRIFNIPDITTDGSFTLGGVVTAVLLTHEYSWTVALPAAFAAGCIAGAVTGWIHTRLGVHPLLAGILTMTALYSVNLSVMGRSNLPLVGVATLFGSDRGSQFRILAAFTIGILLLFSWLLRTDFGLAMRATGNNEAMIRAQGVNTKRMKVTGLALANGMTALSGFLITQIQGFADINMGIGIVILGLGSVMIGEIIGQLTGSRSIAFALTSVLAGSILFRMILAFALSMGIDPVFLKLVVAVFVLIAVSLPRLKSRE